MGSGSTPDPVTLVYKTVPTSSPGPEGGSPEVPLRLDVYLPDSRPNNILAPGNDSAGLPAVVYFHGGGLLVGNRKSWFPEWLHGRLSGQGVAFLSADYRLLSPSTGHDIVEDIQDLFVYIRKDLNPALAGVTGDPKMRIDADAVAVAGSSAGGLCTYLCAMHLSPKPRALLSIYGQAGECLNDNFLEPKAKPFITGRPLVDPSDFTDFIFPRSASLPVITDSPVEYYAPTGLPANRRMFLSRLYYQLGEWLDYYTGDHTLSLRLRRLRSSSSGLETEPPSASAVDPIKAREVIGEKNVGLFPQFGVAEDWPPTIFVHGTKDSQVLLSESEYLAEKLKSVGVENELIVVEGQEHAFDTRGSNVERKFGGLFDRATGFLVQRLRK